MASHDADDNLARAQRDSTGSDRSPLTKRGFLGGSATAVTGSVAGCLNKNGDSTTGRQMTPGQQTATGTGEEGSLSVGRLTTAQHNDIVHAGEYDTLNAAIDDAPDGPVHVVLPDGVTEFDEQISFDRNMVIEGAGKDLSTVRSAGPGGFLAHYDDTPDRTLVLRGFTLDLDHVQTDRTRVILLNGNLGNLIVEDFRGRNVDLSSQDSQDGFIHVTNVEVGLVRIEDAEFRFDTFENRTGEKYFVVKTPQSSVVDRLLVRDSLHVGERIHLADRPEVNHYNAYNVTVGQFGLVSECEFHYWDQYATFLMGLSDATIKVHNNLVLHPGDADMIRTGAQEDGTIVHIHGNVVRHAYMPGDRGIINQNTNNATPAAVKITENVVEDFLVGCSVTGGHNITIADNTFKDIGHATDPADFEDDPRFGDEVGSHVAVLVRSWNTNAQNVRIADNLITNTTDERKMGPGIWVWKGEDWEPGYLVVENNIIVGNDNLRGDDPDQAITLDIDTPVIIERDNEVLDESYEVIE